MWFFRKNVDEKNLDIENNTGGENITEELNEEEELNIIRYSILNENDINSKLALYNKLFKIISTHTKKRKEGLNLYYSWLNNIHFFVNVSIITLSAASTFIQSLVPDYDDYASLKITLLVITTYSGLVLAISKFYKLDDKKEHTNSLRDRFTELQTKVKYHTDTLSPWESGSHYKKCDEKTTDNSSKETAWISLVSEIESEYLNIIDCKRELNSNYEKLLEKGTTKNYISQYEDKKNLRKRAQKYDHAIKNLKLDIKKNKKLLKHRRTQYYLDREKQQIEHQEKELKNNEKSIKADISEIISENTIDISDTSDTSDNIKLDNP